MTEASTSIASRRVFSIVALSALALMALVAPSAHASYLASDLVAFGFDTPQQVTGDKVLDASGHGNDGTLTNVGAVSGKYGRAADFVGSLGSFIRVPDAPSLDGTSGDLTVAFSIATTSSDLGVIAERSTSAGGWTLSVEGGQILVSTSGAARELASTHTVNDGAWHSVAVVYDHGGVQSIYIDGARDISGVVARGPAPAAGDLFIGSADGATGFLTASLDDFRVLDKAFAPEDALLAANAPYPIAQ
ncbi:MAG: LamG domain-containing protein [Thermoplasmatota archaeon]